MARPTNPSGYSQVWWNLVEAFNRKPEGFCFTFEKEKEAMKFRFTFYAFREAVRKGAKKDPSAEVKQECQDALPALNNMKMVITRNEDNSYNLAVRAAKQIRDVNEQAVNGQLMAMLANMGEEKIEEKVEEKEMPSSLDILNIER